MTDFREQVQQSLGSTYTIERELGGGGMSRVFLARDESLGRDIVIKVLDPELAASVSLDRFTREIKVVAALQEPHIVPVLAAGATSDGVPYFTMPFIRGESLRSRLARGPLAYDEAIGILRNVAQALAYAHAQRIVHRDIKPENILLSSGTAMVTDFGIARAIRAARGNEHHGDDALDVGAALSSSTLTSLGTSLGTPAYMSPEQAAGDAVDHRADLYSWGVVAYELLSGAHPFAGKTTAQQLIAAQVSETPHPLRVPGVPDSVARVVMRALAKSPDDRPSSAESVLAELNGPPHRSSSSRRMRVAAAAIAAATALGLAVYAARIATRASVPAAGGATRIAVMPLENASRDTADAYLADGVTDGLIQALSQIPRLSVISRRSTQAARERNASAQDIGRMLGISAFVDGKVQRSGGRLRVSAQLIDAGDGTVRWSQSYDRVTDDALALQDDITRAIAGALRMTLAGRPVMRAPVDSAARARAYDLYLLGQHQAASYDEPGLRRALASYERAAAIDSTFAQPYAGISLVWGNLADDWVAPDEAYPRAMRAAERALAIDPNTEEAYVARAWVETAYQGDLAAARASASRALAINASDGGAMQVLGLSLGFSGMLDSSMAVYRRARALDPLNASLVTDQARVLLYAGRTGEALSAAREALAIDPRFPLAHFIAGQTLLTDGKAAEALAEFKLASGMRDRSLGGIAAAEAALGHAAVTRAIIDTMVAESRRRYVRPEFLAWAYLANGDRDKALTILDQAMRAHAGGMAYVLVDPRWKPIRNEPRFQAIVRQLRR